MDTRHSADSRDYSIEEPAPSPFTATYIARTFRNYRGVIGLALLTVAVGYVILALLAYLLAPSIRLTTLNFRVEFAGAERGNYPNGTKFSSAEIIATPVMNQTYRQNDLDRYTKFTDFVGSVYVVESNEARDALAREYQARLADSRLTSIDRERIQREYELKANSLSKNQFSLNYARRRGDMVPDAVAKKVLHDILKNWADYVTTKQRVLEHRVAVLSPDVVAPDISDTRNPIINTVILRGNVVRLIENIRELRGLPNAELMRTKEGLSLNDISVRLEDIARYRLDPLVDRIAAARLDNRAETLRFLTTQLAYDERVLRWRKQGAETMQRTLSLYVGGQPQQTEGGVPEGSTPPKPADPAAQAALPTGETATLMPQIGDTFIDRLIELTSRSADTDFRQRMAQEYQKYSLAVLPAEAAVEYDRAALESVRNMTSTVTPVDPKEIERELVTTRGNVRQLAAKVGELHKIISQNLNPSTELLTAATPRTRVDRGLSLKTVILLGLLLMLITLVLSVILSLFHSRVKEAEEEERAVARTPAEGTA